MSSLSANWKPNLRDFNKLARPLRLKAFGPAGLVAGAFALVLAAALTVLPSPAQAQAAPAAKPTAAALSDTVLIVGDSLSAEYGLRRGTGWVPLLEKKLAAEKRPVKVINASISGDTTSGGRSRLAGLLAQHKPTIVVIELGGNDALRGLPLDMTEKNLLAMTQASKKAGAKVLLLGMQVPPNYGGTYGKTFAGLFSKVAQAEKVAVVPFFLKGIADVDDAESRFQADRIHPNQQSQATMLANVWPDLNKLLR
ncbi:MAG: arylesterase [Polaromonas sp.]|nr:arylesterase [Polaromonas sp.]